MLKSGKFDFWIIGQLDYNWREAPVQQEPIVNVFNNNQSIKFVSKKIGVAIIIGSIRHHGFTIPVQQDYNYTFFLLCEENHEL